MGAEQIGALADAITSIAGCSERMFVVICRLVVKFDDNEMADAETTAWGRIA